LGRNRGETKNILQGGTARFLTTHTQMWGLCKWNLPFVAGQAPIFLFLTFSLFASWCCDLGKWVSSSRTVTEEELWARSAACGSQSLIELPGSAMMAGWPGCVGTKQSSVFASNENLTSVDHYSIFAFHFVSAVSLCSAVLCE
jgi:hypothetical protein